MEKITREEIGKLADLSELTYSNEEKDAMITEVSNIIAMLDECNSVDTSAVGEPKAVKLNDLRIDTPKDSSIDPLSNANNVEDNFFVVPRQVD